MLSKLVEEFKEDYAKDGETYCIERLIPLIVKNEFLAGREILIDKFDTDMSEGNYNFWSELEIENKTFSSYFYLPLGDPNIYVKMREQNVYEDWKYYKINTETN